MQAVYFYVSFIGLIMYAYYLFGLIDSNSSALSNANEELQFAIERRSELLSSLECDLREVCMRGDLPRSMLDSMNVVLFAIRYDKDNILKDWMSELEMSGSEMLDRFRKQERKISILHSFHDRLFDRKFYDDYHLVRNGHTQYRFDPTQVKLDFSVLRKHDLNGEIVRVDSVSSDKGIVYVDECLRTINKIYEVEVLD